MYLHHIAGDFNRFFRFLFSIDVLDGKLLTQLVHHLDEGQEHRDYN